MFGIEEDNGTKLAAIILQVETSLKIGIFLHILNHSVVPANGSISAKLYICIAFPANHHTISFLKWYEVVNFGFLVVAFVNWVQNYVGFLEFWKLN